MNTQISVVIKPRDTKFGIMIPVYYIRLSFCQMLVSSELDYYSRLVLSLMYEYMKLAMHSA